ncbi:MAG TPA: hypothetical protein VFJ82_24890 [Longimicrobium sp.]|nr:hypothetical protein [Longimicrobium sp.]
MQSLKLVLDPELLAVESFTAAIPDGSANLVSSIIRDTVARETEWISCYASDCGTCGGTDCWV